MPSVYNYHHVELDKVGRGKRVIQPPGGQSADIFGRTNEQGGSFSSASSQAGSDVGSARIRIDTDHQSIASSNQHQMPVVDGIVKQVGQQQQSSGGQASPTGSIGSSVASGQLPSAASSLIGDAFQPTMQPMGQQQLVQQQNQQQQQQMNQQLQQQLQQDGTRTPKKTIPILRRNPITGEILENPGERQQPVVRVRQPPGGHSSGIF